MSGQLKVAVVAVTPFQQNCSILWCERTKKAAIVDPGGEADKIRNAIAHFGVTPEKILITHGHLDHVGAAAEIAAHYGVPVEGPHEDDASVLANVEAQAVRFGVSDCKTVTPDRWLNEGDTVSFGEITMDVLHVPGHAPGHVVFVHPASEFAVVGDTLFRGSVGRTDLPMGDHDQLISQIRQNCSPLVMILPFFPAMVPPRPSGRNARPTPILPIDFKESPRRDRLCSAFYP